MNNNNSMEKWSRGGGADLISSMNDDLFKIHSFNLVIK